MGSIHPRSISFFAQVTVLIVVGASIGWIFAHLSKNASTSETAGDGKYEFDSTVDPSIPLEAQLDRGQRLALIVGIGAIPSVPEYLGVLFRKYQTRGLRVLLVLPSDSPRNLGLRATAEGIPWVTDLDGRFQRLLRFSSAHRHDATLIFDDHYNVKFHALGLPNNDLLRQLTEKYLIGKINYSPDELLTSSLAGRRVEGLQCPNTLAPSTRQFVVFPPGCSSCEVNSYREQLLRLSQAGGKFPSMSEHPFLVFRNERNAETLALARELGFSDQEVCAVRENILWDPYQTRRNPESAPVVIRTDQNGVIVDVRNLTALQNGGDK
jgi:hypothetical protein